MWEGFGPAFFMTEHSTWQKRLGSNDGISVQSVVMESMRSEGAIPDNLAVQTIDPECTDVR